MRDLARRLGVGTSTLYYYVGSREELARLVADRALEQLRFDVMASGVWRPAMLRTARALRLVFSDRPAMAESAIRRPSWGETVVQLHEEACAHLVRAGFSPGGAFLAVRAVADLVEAHTIRTYHQREAGASDLEQASQTFGDHPTLARALEQLGDTLSDQRFEFALRSLVRGMTPS